MKYYFLHTFCVLAIFLDFSFSNLESTNVQKDSLKEQINIRSVKIKVVEDTTYNKHNYIHYRDADHIKWTDFKGRTKPGQVAYTAVEIVCDIKGVEETLDTSIYTVSVSCLFSKNQSFNTPGNRKIWLLEHEIMHVKIAAIEYINFIKQLQQAAFNENEDVPQQIAQLYHATIDACKNEQEKYDLLTKHGLNRKIQYQRNAHISKELEKIDNLIF